MVACVPGNVKRRARQWLIAKNHVPTIGPRRRPRASG